MCSSNSGLSCVERQKLGLCKGHKSAPNRLVALEQLEFMSHEAEKGKQKLTPTFKPTSSGVPKESKP